MARGHDLHKQRQAAIASLGRPLSRRAHSRCELCEARGTRLVPFEVAPIPEEPDPGCAVLICERCLAGAQGGRLDPNEWRFLENSAWSDVAPVQVAAVRLLGRLSAAGADWATDLQQNLYLPPEVEEWLG